MPGHSAFCLTRVCATRCHMSGVSLATHSHSSTRRHAPSRPRFLSSGLRMLCVQMIAVPKHAAYSMQPSGLHPCGFMCGGMLKHKMASRASVSAVPASRHCASCMLPAAARLGTFSLDANASPTATQVSSLCSQLPRNSVPYRCATHRQSNGMSLTTRSCSSDRVHAPNQAASSLPDTYTHLSRAPSRA